MWHQLQSLAHAASSALSVLACLQRYNNYALPTSLAHDCACPYAALCRLYRQYMASFVLCPAYTSQGTCINGTGPVMCAWNPRRQRCEADKYASFLMPMVCPGSAAHTYLNCMRKPSEAACKADDACTAEHAHACLPRTMVAQAKASNSSVQAMAERLALGVLKGAWRRLQWQHNCSSCRRCRTVVHTAAPAEHCTVVSIDGLIHGNTTCPASIG